MYKTNLAPQLSSRTAAELGTGTEWEKRRSELQNTFVPPRCWAGLGLFSTSQGSEHPRGLTHPASHSSCQLGNIWAVENTSSIRMFQLPPSQPAPSCLDSTDSRLRCLGRDTTAPFPVLHVRQRLCCARTGCTDHHEQKAQSRPLALN